MSNLKNPLFWPTGNEDDRTYSCIYEMTLLGEGYKFSKSVIVFDNQNYDEYNESFRFPTYIFTVSKRISKINLPDKDINVNFVHNFICNINKEDWCQKCN